MSVNLDSHDLQLSSWGPYSKRYSGISHIPDVSKGLRFDLAIMPGYYRRQMLIPNEKWASGQHAWDAAADLSYYSYRYEIEWKDQVYCDVSFSKISENKRLIRSEFVNNTNLAQDLMLHLVAYMNFPPVRAYSDDPIQLLNVELPQKGQWFDALDYTDLQFATSRPSDNLVEDGFLRAEIRDHGLVNGNAIGCGFGEEPGDNVSFNLRLNQTYKSAVISIRYRLDKPTKSKIKLEGLLESTIDLTGENPDEFGFSILSIPVGKLIVKEQSLLITSKANIGFVLDGFAIYESEDQNAIKLVPHKWSHEPDIIDNSDSNNIILKYPDTDVYYGIAWDHNNAWLRQLFTDELDRFLRAIVPDNYSAIQRDSGEGHFTDVFLRPISMAPKSTEVHYSFVCSGTQSEVEQALKDFEKEQDKFNEIYLLARANAVTTKGLPAGNDYHFSQNRMSAVELLNVVYPVYTRRQFIRHHTPGKWWDCLYTWDSGFIGLALLELDKQRAIDCLNAYVTPPGDMHAAFIHHGSPVPTQMYLFHELWNRTQDKSFLQKFYPSMRQYYLFLSGNSESSSSSTTRELKSNMLRTWEYFFESGGWDDYPAQMHTHQSGIKSRIAPAVISAHAIRSAKILLAAAHELGIEEDFAIYEDDIKVLTAGLQQHSWDEQAGYFSYVVHDDDGNPIKPLCHESGLNFNMGLDGVMPIFAGICSEEQESILLDRLHDSKRFWTDIGLSTVDQSAPYYRKDGYWNGAVWMPQQWFIWKTALDLGQGAFAHKIAMTALELWKSEVGNSYYCFEHFIIESGRGAGWHQFSGLSSPVISWYQAYFCKGRLTTGMDIWVEEKQFADDNRSFSSTLRLTGKLRIVSVIINMEAEGDYFGLWNENPIKLIENHPGSFQIDIPFEESRGLLAVIDKTLGNRESKLTSDDTLNDLSFL